MTMSIDGLGIVRYQQREYTSAAVVNEFTHNIQVLQIIMQKPFLSLDDMAVFATTMTQLHSLSKNGVTDSTGTHYMMPGMANDLKMIVQSLKATGLDFSNVDAAGNLILPVNLTSLDQLRNWQSLAGFGVAELLTQAIANVSGDRHPTRTLQSMVELEYIKEGNEMIAEALGDLEEALELTQKAMDNLTTLQTIANRINVQPPSSTIFANGGFNGTVDGGVFGSIDLNTTTSISAITTYYRTQAMAYFQQIVPNNSNLTSTTPYELLQAKVDLMQNVRDLEQQLPGVTRSTVNSLPFFLFQVVKDISASFAKAIKAVFPDFYATRPDGLVLPPGMTPEGLLQLLTSTTRRNAASNWIIDNLDKLLSDPNSKLSGEYFGHLTQAIKGTQSLNDKKKQEVNNYMFLFQEFYKSSSAVLSKVSQIVERMAQGISR